MSFPDPRHLQAMLAINHLDKCKLWGKVIRSPLLLLILFSLLPLLLLLLLLLLWMLLLLLHLLPPTADSPSPRVMHSKHTTVQLPKDGQPDAGLTKDYGNSGLHRSVARLAGLLLLLLLLPIHIRFKKPGSKNYQNIYPPSATLHLSNIPSSVEEDDLKKAFDAINLTVQVVLQ